MRIDVSKANCQPSTSPKAESVGGRCAGCKIDVSTGLEWHMLPAVAGSAQKRVRLCPMCHHSQHLDFAGIRGSGVMIWLPEIEQGALNLICALIFSATADHRKREALRVSNSTSSPDGVDELHAEEVTAARQVQHLENLYRTFMNRSEPLSAVAGFRNSSVDVTSPAFIAQSIVRAIATDKVSPADVLARMDGVRFLPIPKSFVGFREIVSNEVLAKYPLDKWFEYITDPEVLQLTTTDGLEQEPGLGSSEVGAQT